MNINNVREFVERERIDNRFVSIGEASHSGADSHVLNYEGGEWLVYYIERGVKSKIVNFSTEDAACEYFIKWISGMSFFPRIAE